MAKRPCQGQTRAGAACKRQALKGKDYCGDHLPAETERGDGGDASAAHTRETWDRTEFLAALEYTHMVSEACKMVGISRQSAYRERQSNEEFALAWADVEERSTEQLEAEARRRAHDGVPKMIVSAGKRLGTEQQYSDTLLTFLLKARRPEKYRERVDVAHSGGVQADVKIRVDLSALDADELDALEKISGKLQKAA